MSDRTDSITSWAWVPIPALLLAMLGLWALDLQGVYPAPRLLPILQLVFMTLVSGLVAYLVVSSFLARGAPELLLLGCGILAWGVSGVVAGLVSRGDVNASVTVHNLCVWLSAFCHLTGVIARSPRRSVRERGWFALAALAVLGGAIVVIAHAATAGWTPTFFVQGQGGTLVRQIVLGSAIGMYAISGTRLLVASRHPERSAFPYWYGLGLCLNAAGLFGVLIQSVHSGVLGWTGVATQWLAGVYLAVAAVAAARESRAWELPLTTAARRAPIHYGLAVLFVAAAIVARVALLQGTEVQAPYLMYYPAVILAALCGGWRPALLAIVLAASAANALTIDPLGDLRLGATVDWVSTGFFVGNCLAMVFVVEAMQRAQARALAAEAEARVAAERQRTVEALQRSEEALREADRRKDQFLAMLGHELRTPLGAITSAASLLDAAGGAGDTAGRARAVIARQVQHLSRLVDDLLDVSRVTSGKVALVRRPVDLAALAASTVAGWPASDGLRQHRVSVEASPAWIDADETRMAQVLSNLLGNALKYTPAGGEVSIRVRAEGDTALLQVEDTGVGIPPSLVPKVFDLFVQGPRTMDRAQGGLGVGLTLVKVLVEMHGGTVDATSAGDGQGAAFTVRLRCIPAPAAAPPGPGPASGPRRRILVIEDSADAREMLRAQLSLAGHEVQTAGDGLVGVSLAATVTPDVALIDIGLPGIDGYEVARRIRAGAGGQSVTLIALTGYGQAEDRRRALEAGFDAHLTKPFPPERLAELVGGAAAPR